MMTLPYSDALSFQAFPRECTEAFLVGIIGPSATPVRSPTGSSQTASMCSAAGWSAPPTDSGHASSSGYSYLLENATLDELASAVDYALVLAACGQGRKVRFFRVTELIGLLLEAREEKTLIRLRKQIKQLDLAILDELGYVPTGKTGAELLFDVLSTAYERQSLIVTTNLPFEQWTEVLGSERRGNGGWCVAATEACRSGGGGSAPECRTRSWHCGRRDRGASSLGLGRCPSAAGAQIYSQDRAGWHQPLKIVRQPGVRCVARGAGTKRHRA